MIKKITFLLIFALVAGCGRAPADGAQDIASQLRNSEHLAGYFDLYWDKQQGRLIVKIDSFDTPFLYVSSMARGVGSNDIGLDRGQLGGEKVVRFQRSGPKILLVEDNLDYRALTDNADEQNAVAESFARSVIWGFEALGEDAGSVFVDATEFLLRDAHGVGPRLAQMEEGAYVVDPSRSAIYRPMTKAFPDNSEMEAIVTFTGQATGPHLPTVVPDSDSFSVHLHHSFIRLPDDSYEPLTFEPRAGGIPLSGSGFLDYASPVGDPLSVSYAVRFRLEKQDPSLALSDPVKPIVYYVDRGAPEPIRSALIEGASWWNQAFEAAGYRNAFQVELLPEGADPMDVRYNIIQWVHRSTRGWSYGGSISDPRTGEIMKGKVTLGSLRVRQDYLIAEGLLAPYGDEEKPDVPMEMALSRIRQLSAHEVGHTIGFTHNMAASSQGRTSVMDYPHPLIQFDDDGNINLDEAYAVGIGAWDKRTVEYTYQDFQDDVDRDSGRNEIMAATIETGLRFVSDTDSRPVSAAHPLGNLWDNGADAIEELENLLRVRAVAMGRMSERNIRPGRSFATLEEVLVPIYLIHRFQLHAVGKLVGGEDFYYAMRGDGQPKSTPVGADRQRQAIAALLNTITPSSLRIPDHVLRLIPPRPPGNPKSRETFPSNTGKLFEPFGAAQSAASLTMEVLLEPSRAARLIAANARQTTTPGFDELTADLLRATWFAPRQSGIDAELQRLVNSLALQHLMLLAVNKDADTQVRAIALDSVNQLDDWLSTRAAVQRDASWRAHYSFASFQIDQMRNDPSGLEQIEPVVVPPGEPIGTTLDWH
jgi:hypothetical protein